MIEKIKVYFVEATDPYGDRSVVESRSFFDESQADALEKKFMEKFGGVYSSMGQEMYVEFAHRNGETDEPEIDGWYWVEYQGIWTIERNPCQHSEFIVYRFFGPIPMPEKV